MQIKMMNYLEKNEFEIHVKNLNLHFTQQKMDT